MDFDAVLDLEADFLREGESEGKREGTKNGLETGYRIGLIKGREVGWELGCFLGLRKVVGFQCSTNPEHPLSKKLEKPLQQFDSLMKKFPMSDPTQENLFTVLDQIRGKVKQICSLLGISYADLIGDHQSSFSSEDLRTLASSVLSF